MVWPALCMRHRNETQHFTLVFQKSCEHMPKSVRKGTGRKKQHFEWDVLFPSCSMIFFLSFGCCLKIIILRLVWSTRCHDRLTQTEMENDGNNRQQRARGFCSIDPIALIKVVYREYTLSNDGWLLVILQQPRNITPLICGVLTQPLTTILATLTSQEKHKKSQQYLLTICPVHLWKVEWEGGTYGPEVDYSKKDTYLKWRRERKLSVCDHGFALPGWSPRQSERAQVEGSELIAF